MLSVNMTALRVSNAGHEFCVTGVSAFSGAMGHGFYEQNFRKYAAGVAQSRVVRVRSCRGGPPEGSAAIRTLFGAGEEDGHA